MQDIIITFINVLIFLFSFFIEYVSNNKQV